MPIDNGNNHFSFVCHIYANSNIVKSTIQEELYIVENGGTKFFLKTITLHIGIYRKLDRIVSSPFISD